MNGKNNPYTAEHRREMLQSPEQLGEYLHVSSVSSLLICITVLLLMGAFFLWAFLGRITDKVYYSGILFPVEGVTDISLPDGGVLRTLMVSQGEHVQVGQSVALVSMVEPGMTYKHESYSILSAPASGIVISSKAEGESFNSLEPIVSLVSEKGKNGKACALKLIAWADNESRRDLREGMEAQVWPSDEKRDEIGYVVGHVITVSQYPTTMQLASSQVRSTELAQSVIPVDKTAYQIEVALEHAVDDPSILHWSFGQPENVTMNVGTICNVMTETRSRTIVKYFFEQVRFKANIVRQWME